MNPRKRQEGFTIIELVVVIAIVAIMAAVALPRFVDLQSEARDASLNAVFGGYQAAIQLVHAKWLAATTSPTTVPLEGATVIINAAGWPTIDAANTDQDTADKLYAIIMGAATPGTFTGTQTAGGMAGTATFTQAGSSDTVEYDGATGIVTCANC